MASIDTTTSDAPVKVVIPAAPRDILEWRRASGADRWDESWDGVLHMPPMPNRDHQDFEFQTESWLRGHWARPRGARVYHQINLAISDDWLRNYRIPDLVLLTPDRFAIDRNEVFVGPPLVVVEIRSPGDESYDKLDFFAELGVPEVWIIDRDSKQPEVFALRGGKYSRLDVDADGWLRSPATGVEFRVDQPGRLTLRLAGDEATRESLPN